MSSVTDPLSNDNTSILCRYLTRSGLVMRCFPYPTSCYPAEHPNACIRGQRENCRFPPPNGELVDYTGFFTTQTFTSGCGCRGSMHRPGVVRALWSFLPVSARWDYVTYGRPRQGSALSSRAARVQKRFLTCWDYFRTSVTTLGWGFPIHPDSPSRQTSIRTRGR